MEQDGIMATIMAETAVDTSKEINKLNRVTPSTGDITEITDRISDIAKGGTLQITLQSGKETTQHTSGTTDIALLKAITKS
jgi:hypothetical protein